MGDTTRSTRDAATRSIRDAATRSIRGAATRSAQGGDNGENSKNGDECLGEVCRKYDCSMLDRENVLPANRRSVSPV